MKVDIFRLISIDPYGIGNKGNGLLDLLYSYFLSKKGLDYYKYIKVNQIHQQQGIEEFVDIEKGAVHVNIIFNTRNDFENLTELEKNQIRLNLIHAGLLCLGDRDRRFSKEALENIKEEILQNNFNFDVEVKTEVNPYNTDSRCKLLISPYSEYFDYYILVQQGKKNICKIKLYRSKPIIFYLQSFFNTMKWQTKDKVLIGGKEKQMKMIVDIEHCKVDFHNLTPYPILPLWEMGKTEISEHDSLSAYENWLHSLPPEYLTFLRESRN